MVSSGRNCIERHEHSKVDIVDGPSRWRQKFGTQIDTSKQEIEDDKFKSINDWITSLRDNADIDAAVSNVCLKHLILPDNYPVDKDAADVIVRMNKLFDGISTSNNINFNNNGIECYDRLDCMAFDDKDDFDVKSFSKCMQASNFPCDPLLNTIVSIERNEKAFSGENMAILFRRSHDDEIARKCIHCLLSLVKENRILRGRVFSQWKKVASAIKESKEVHVRRFRRRRRLRLLRRLLSIWLKASHDRNVRVQRAAQMRGLRTKGCALISWRRLSQQRKTRRNNVGSVIGTKLMKMKHSTILAWLAITRRSEHPTQLECGTSISCRSDPGQQTCAVITTDDDTPKSQTAVTATLTKDTQEMGEVQQLKNQHPNNHVQKDTMPEPMQQIKDFDKANKHNHKISLLRPLRHKSQKHLQNTATPKLVLEMNKRKQEREISREILRQRYEQKAIEKEKILKEDLRKRYEEESKVQREFSQQKALEEHGKKLAASQWKQACYLAAMHRRRFLQKRMLLQWKKIFQINRFNERKAFIAWSDTTSEKCWRNWLRFKNEQQIVRHEQMLVHQQLADDFNERRLLATAFAALEVQCQYTRSRLVKGRSQVSALRQLCILSKWQCAIIDLRNVRYAKEVKAKRNGSRLCLMRALQSWRSGAKENRKEREIRLMIEAKRRQVNNWLEGNRC